MRTTLKPLFNLAIAALLAQAAPESGAHLLSCGFTHALRTIQSTEAAKRNALTASIESKRGNTAGSSNPFRLHVSVVERGFIRTGRTAYGEFLAQPIFDYEPWQRQMIASPKDSVEAASQPLTVARTIVRAIESHRPRLRCCMGRDARLVLALRSSLPYSWFAQGMRRSFRLDAEAKRDLFNASHVKNGARNLT